MRGFGGSVWIFESPVKNHWSVWSEEQCDRLLNPAVVLSGVWGFKDWYLYYLVSVLSWRVPGFDILHCFFRNLIPLLRLLSFGVGGACWCSMRQDTIAVRAKSKFVKALEIYRNCNLYVYKTTEYYAICVCACVCEVRIIPWSPSEGPSDVPVLTLDTGARTAQAPRQHRSTQVVPALWALNKQGELAKTKERHGSTGISDKSSDLLYS